MPTEALAHGVVSRWCAADQLDATVREIAENIAAKPRVSVNMARRIIRHLSEPQIRSSMADELIGQTFINKSSDYAELRAARAEEPRADLHRELSVTNLPGLAEPPEEGASALPAGTYEGQTVLVTGGGTGLGRAIAVEFARLGANLVVASRKAEHLDAARAAIEAVPGPIEVVTCDIRDPEQIAAAFDQATAALRPARRADQQRRRQLPRARPRTCRPTPGGRWSTSR